MVVIRGMEKPKNCRGCVFNFADCWCKHTKGSIDRDDMTCDIPCPIVEIPEEAVEFLEKLLKEE